MYYFSEVEGADDLFCMFYDYDYRNIPHEFYCNLYSVLEEIQNKLYMGEGGGDLYFSPDYIMDEIIITRYPSLEWLRKACSHVCGVGSYISPTCGNVLAGFDDPKQKALAGGYPAIYLCTDYSNRVVYSSQFLWFRQSN